MNARNPCLCTMHTSPTRVAKEKDFSLPICKTSESEIATMSTPSPHTRRLADPEDLRLSSLDEDSRPSKSLLDHSDEESGRPEDALLFVEKEKKHSPPGSSNFMLFVWIVVNTLATIGIVSIGGSCILVRK